MHLWKLQCFGLFLCVHCEILFFFFFPHEFHVVFQKGLLKVRALEVLVCEDAGV